jgi:hypothetical protein
VTAALLAAVPPRSHTIQLALIDAAERIRSPLRRVGSTGLDMPYNTEDARRQLLDDIAAATDELAWRWPR